MEIFQTTFSSILIFALLPVIAARFFTLVLQSAARRRELRSQGEHARTRGTRQGGKTATFTRVTDLQLGRDTVRIVMRGARRWWAIESETFKTLEYGEICAVSSATSGTATTICATCSDCSPCWPCKSSGPAEPPRDVQKALRHRQNLYLRDGPRVLVAGSPSRAGRRSIGILLGNWAGRTISA